MVAIALRWGFGGGLLAGFKIGPEGVGEFGVRLLEAGPSRDRGTTPYEVSAPMSIACVACMNPYEVERINFVMAAAVSKVRSPLRGS